MNELALVFLGGLLGSGHCLGMCGGFAIAIGSTTTSRGSMLASQLIYTLGRIFTYSVLGAIVGYAGMRLTAANGYLAHSQAALALVAGVLLIGQGLVTVGWIRWPRRSQPKAGCLASSWFAPFFRQQGAWATFCAGLMTGFLPCGLVYSFLALAAASGNLMHSLAYMAAFGAGTAPMMILAGCGAHWVGVGTRQTLFRLAACCVILTGGLSVARGVQLWSTPSSSAGVCPLCH